MMPRIAICLLPLLWLAGCGMGASKSSDTKEAARVNSQLGIEYLRKGDIELARGKLEKAVELDSSNAEAHGALGLLYADTGEIRKSEKHYEKSLDLNPDDPSVLNNYGTLLCAQGKYSKADQQFRRATQNPRYQSPEVALTNAGVCARKMPDDIKAEQYFRDALTRNPNFTDALAQLALLHADQAQYLKARAFLQRYQGLQAPMTRDVLLLGIRVELALGDREAAQVYAQRLQTDYPDNAYDTGTHERDRQSNTIQPH
jgi:type IV pilus assembly protein PilF